MRVLTSLLILSFIMTLTPSTNAGTRIGNGGAVWVCKNKGKFFKKDYIEWIKVVDLFEAEFEFGLPANDFSGKNTTTIIDEVMQNLRESTFFDMSLLESIKLGVLTNIKPVNSEINETQDIFYRIKPPEDSCPEGKVSEKPIQIANYTGYGTLLIRADIWNSKQLNDVNRAALIMHEVIYTYMRETYSDTDSVRARMLVGILFSKLTKEAMFTRLEKVFGLSTTSGR